MNAWIASVGTSVPANRVAQADVRETVRAMFAPRMPHLERLLGVFDNGGIAHRHFCMPLDWYAAAHSVEEKHRLFVEHAVALAEKAVRQCLDRAGAAPADVGHIVLVTTTGTATPSIDAHLCNRLRFAGSVKRSPLWGLGCAGGAAGLSRACEYVEAFPDELCLVVAVELCSLTFLRDDASKSNLVATSLFADGAAAALVAGSGRRGRDPGAPSVAATRSTIWPDTLDVMGWDVTNDGLKVVFSRDIPALVRERMPGAAHELLAPHGLRAAELARFALHPGGKKVLQAYEDALRLPPGRLAAAERVLRDYGNMSSCTVLFVLEEMLRAEGPPERGSWGIAGALGPGFSSELLLLRWA
ncbi:type III polyketide synthase [Paenibacillus sp.]|uniref:type III polyketide synthase n=1 Tax=Paenibacillus sp. TaxID=58172 RepID=UPI002D71736F|nr:3-oxoacyl-[acyl-carrier-protein] synthase III C-terminal domain-containing protein [Paenibacillus sp.]HZG87665.1 3-oxoacyl-[acyl-carrier-protein] synthase III C-terminal domain-containing protein [Paenibacillus sp.]